MDGRAPRPISPSGTGSGARVSADSVERAGPQLPLAIGNFEAIGYVLAPAPARAAADRSTPSAEVRPRSTDSSAQLTAALN
jgi:hypothetical protein